MLELVNISKRYDNNLLAVNNVSTNISKKEIYCLLGPNGAGKTTILKIITGIERFFEGNVLVGGFDNKVYPIKTKKLIGYVSDEPFLYDYLTGREFLEFIADIWQMEKLNKLNNIEKYVRIFDLYEKIDVLIRNYSKGMRQKIALVGALIHEPKLLILDEPFTGVDAIIIKQIKDLLVNYANNGNTVVLSTHILELAEQLSTRIGIINKGRILKEMVYGQANDSLENIFIEFIKKDDIQ